MVFREDEHDELYAVDIGHDESVSVRTPPSNPIRHYFSALSCALFAATMVVVAVALAVVVDLLLSYLLFHVSCIFMLGVCACVCVCVTFGVPFPRESCVGVQVPAASLAPSV